MPGQDINYIAYRINSQQDRYKLIQDCKYPILLYIYDNLDNDINVSVAVGDYLKRYEVPRNKSNKWMAVYSRFYRALKCLQGSGIVELVKFDGILFALPQVTAFNLKAQVQNSNQRKNESINPVYKFPKKSRPEIIEARKLTASAQYLSQDKQDKILDLFDDYLDDINSRKIVLFDKKAELCRYTGQPYVYLDYLTRFNSQSRQIPKLELFENIMDYTVQEYDKGVMLTLTTHPDRFYSMWRANRHFQVAWNRFLSYLSKHNKRWDPEKKKKKPQRPLYTSVFEFTEKGFLHVHVLFFGIKWLLPQKTIAKEWDRCGQGYINHIFQIKSNGKEWTWSRQKPRDAKPDENTGDYLKKYIKKAMYNFDGRMRWYWVFNKRFFSNSRVFNEMFKEDKLKAETTYKFLGSWTIYNIPDYITADMDRYKTSFMAYMSGNKRTQKESEGPPNNRKQQAGQGVFNSALELFQEYTPDPDKVEETQAIERTKEKPANNPDLNKSITGFM